VLALPDVPGIYAQRDDREAEIPTGSSVVPISALRFEPRAALARGSLDRSLRTALFAAEFSVDYYRGVVDSQGLVAVDFTGSPRLIPVPLAAPTGSGVGYTDVVQPLAGWVAPALLVTSGTALITSAVTLGLALDAKADFDATQQMRDAFELRDRYETNMTIALTSAIVSGGTAAAAWLLWPDDGEDR
jgi:hypothetical protein